MGRLMNIITPLHKRAKREYLPRMVDDKVHCMLKAKEYEFDYWDGDRRYGYGGYRYLEGRWAPVAKGLIDLHGLKGKCRILDVGCGKGVLLKEFQRLLPEAELWVLTSQSTASLTRTPTSRTSCSATARRTPIRLATNRSTS